MQIVIGHIDRASALNGALKVTLYSGSCERLVNVKKFYVKNNVYQLDKKIRPQGRKFIFKFVEIADRDAAEQLKSLKLSVDRQDLPELPAGERYQIDLIGMAVRNEAGLCVGHVVSFDNFGAGDLINIISEPDCKEITLPFNSEYFDKQKLILRDQKILDFFS